MAGNALQPDTSIITNFANSFVKDSNNALARHRTDKAIQTKRNALRALHGGDEATALSLAPETVGPFQAQQQARTTGELTQRKLRREESAAMVKAMLREIGGVLALPPDAQSDGYRQGLVRLRQQFGPEMLEGIAQEFPGIDALTNSKIQLSQAATIDGAFKGKGLPAQLLNALLDPNADVNSPKYEAAFNRVAEPKVTFDPATGFSTLRTPDMTAFRRPGGGGMGSAATVEQINTGTTKLTDAQSKAAGFYDRLIAADETLMEFEGAGTNLGARVLERLPGGNLFQATEFQQFERARRDFVNAVLRRESGAVINPEEFTNAEKQYFPQPGDKPAVIKKKRQARRRAVANMRREAGPGFKPSPAPAPQVAPPAERPPGPKPGDVIPQLSAESIGRMSVDDLSALPPISTLSPDQRRAVLNRVEALERERARQSQQGAR